MTLTPIIAKLRAHAKSIPVYDWDETNTDKELLDFHEGVKTASDNFWYCLNNGYIETNWITTTPVAELTKAELDEIAEIVEEFGIEF